MSGRCSKLRGGELSPVETCPDPERRPIGDLCFSPDEQEVLVGTWNGTTQLLRVDSLRLVRPFAEHEHVVQAVAFAPDGRRIATASQDGLVRVYDLAGAASPMVLTSRERAAVFRVAFVGNDRLVTASSDGSVKWWWLTAADLRAALASFPLPK